MAKVKIQGHASGTGVVTVTAPNTSTDRTITLPDSTDTLAVNSDVTNKLPLAGGTMTGNLTLTGADIVKSGSADLTVDVGGRIILSADDNGEIRVQDGASIYGQFKDDDDRFRIEGLIADKDIMFIVNDGGVATTAFTIGAASGGDTTTYGNVVIGTAGKGIDFSANSNAGGMTSELLDDYEEGTWTPTITAYSGTNPTIGGNSAGKYTKIGNMCTCHFNFNSLTASGTTSGILQVSLPFTASGDWTGALAYNEITFARPENTLWINIGTTHVGILSSINGGGWAWESVNIIDAGGVAAFRGSLSYRTA